MKKLKKKHTISTLSKPISLLFAYLAINSNVPHIVRRVPPIDRTMHPGIGENFVATIVESAAFAAAARHIGHWAIGPLLGADHVDAAHNADATARGNNLNLKIPKKNVAQLRRFCGQTSVRFSFSGIFALLNNNSP